MSKIEQIKAFNISDFYDSDNNEFLLSKEKKECSEQLKKIIEILFKTDVLLLNDFLNDDKYINFFKIKQIKNVVLNADMINTVNCYLKNAMNTSVACMAGYMHRNTMIYRIQKIKNVVGLDIRLFDEAVLFNNMLTCSKLLNE